MCKDVELSYRMSAPRWKMKFVPEAWSTTRIQSTLSQYLKKKYKFAFWRVLVSQEP